MNILGIYCPAARRNTLLESRAEIKESWGHPAQLIQPVESEGGGPSPKSTA